MKTALFLAFMYRFLYVTGFFVFLFTHKNYHDMMRVITYSRLSKTAKASDSFNANLKQIKMDGHFSSFLSIHMLAFS